MLTVGALVYPLPAVSTTTSDTLSPLRIALAVAPLPPPPVIVTVGSLEYPEPPEVTVMPLTKPAVDGRDRGGWLTAQTPHCKQEQHYKSNTHLIHFTRRNPTLRQVNGRLADRLYGPPAPCIEPADHPGTSTRARPPGRTAAPDRPGGSGNSPSTVAKSGSKVAAWVKNGRLENSEKPQKPQ